MMMDWLTSLASLVNDGVIDPDEEDCCVLTARLLAKHAGLSAELGTSSVWWRDANVWDADDRFSSVRAAAQVASRVKSRDTTYAVLQYEDGLTWKRIEHHLKPKHWYFLQGWRDDGTGHAWMMRVGVLPTMANVLVESSRSKGLRVNEVPWKPGSTIGPPVSLRDRLLQFKSGLGLAELW